MDSFVCTLIAVLFLVLLVKGQSVWLDRDEAREWLMADWFNDDSHPPAEEFLTERQQFWFHSLGYAGAFNRRSSSFSVDGENVDGRRLWEPNCLRKEYRTLTDEERTRYHDAFNAMKSTMIDNMSEYDIFVTYHWFPNAPAAHGGAAFFAWHREFLFRYVAFRTQNM